MAGRSVREERERRFGRRFFALVGGVWIGTLLIFGATTVNWFHGVSLARFALMVVFLFSFAFVSSRRVLSLVLPPFRLPSLDQLVRQPRVAVLYTTMNDVVPDCLRSVRQDYPVDVFVLDDASDPGKRALVDRVAEEIGATVLRRQGRKGFKAGAINRWLSVHGREYEYFVLLDADSLLPRDWVGHALRFAEHPENADLAIFQGMINIWNTDVKFAGALAPAHVLSHDEWERKLAGYLGSVVCYGHNVLIRTRPVLELGGFTEGYVSEDFATAVALASRGHGSAFLPLHSWEALPENVRGFVKRQNKWTRGSMEFFAFVPRATIPLHKKIILLMIPCGHLAYVVRSMLVYLVARKRRFPVTPKDEPPMSMREILSVARGTMALVALVTAGLVLWNPVGLYYNLLWLIPFYTSPLVIHHYCGPRSRPTVAMNGGHKDLLADPRLWTALDLHRNRWR